MEMAFRHLEDGLLTSGIGNLWFMAWIQPKKRSSLAQGIVDMEVQRAADPHPPLPYSTSLLRSLLLHNVSASLTAVGLCICSQGEWSQLATQEAEASDCQLQPSCKLWPTPAKSCWPPELLIRSWLSMYICFSPGLYLPLNTKVPFSF